MVSAFTVIASSVRNISGEQLFSPLKSLRTPSLLQLQRQAGLPAGMPTGMVSYVAGRQQA
jgi:hypothetical protein